MKTIFFGSSDYCLPIVESINNNFQLLAVITKKGQSVEQFALSHNIKVFTPQDHNELSALKKEIISLQPDLAVVADYGLIIPKEIFTIPHHKTLNIHFSKLPLLRGPSPVQYTILLGEKSAWISVIIMDEGIDTGDIVWQKEITSFNIENETTESLYTKLFNIIALELPDIINKYVKNELKPQKQDNLQATYTKHLTRQDGYISPQALAAALQRGVESVSLDRKIRAFTPWPGVWTTVNLPSPKRLKLLKVHLKGGKFVLDLVQLEGKKPVSWKQFVEGYPANTLITQV